MTKKAQIKPYQGLFILGLIWLAGVACDRLWFALDRSVPAWDQADYLNGAMNYWQALQTPQWLNREWWVSFWLLSSKIPPLNYILTVPFLNLFGTTADAATLVMLLYSAILLVSVYGLGVALFDVSVGLWAAGICQLLPGLYRYRLDFLLDYPLASAVTLSFYVLTLWYFSPSWPRAVLFGLSLGLALLLKQTALFFLLLPLLWALGEVSRRRQWGRLGQWLAGLCVAVMLCYPWYRTNWLLILTSSKRATIDSAIAEGDPPLNTLAAWTYYGQVLPSLLSWVLLLVPLVCLLIYGGRWYGKNWQLRRHNSPSNLPKCQLSSKWTWLAVFLLGGYFLSSLNINKDARYILPLLPVLSLVLAVGLLSWPGRWKQYIRWGTVGLAFLLMLFNLFPLGGKPLTQLLSPHSQHHPYTGKPWPHEEVIAEIAATSPYLRSTLAVLPSTPAINQHNFSFYGKVAKAEISGRQVGVKEEEVKQDARSLDWFLTKTGPQGSVPSSQAAIVELVEQGGDFQRQKSWQLPDDSTLKLYHRRIPSVEVTPLSQPRTQVQLDRVIVPEQAPPGLPIPVTYQWSGPWPELQSGIVLLTWHPFSNPQSSILNPQSSIQNPQSSILNPKSKIQNPKWLHDRAIGMGMLSKKQHPSQTTAFQVKERTAMLPDKDIAPGTYTLTATYLNRETGTSYPLAVIPPVTITIDPQAEPTPAPELDLVTQLRAIAPSLAQGPPGLEAIFAQTARINQYDAAQDYLVQAEKALSYRLKGEKRLDWAYTLALANVLQQDVPGAIAALQQVIELDSQNPYAYAYLAFVYLYDWHPQLAQEALKPALRLNPNLPELKTLRGIAALMQGNFLKAWQELEQID